ncbi:MULTISPECIES: RDD family protein [unclassified Streptomyces]|uniref:RDD family protein n=1 Tax=unclassified Streptomyces TaxID=2593676 RepID=UPI0038021FA2
MSFGDPNNPYGQQPQQPQPGNPYGQQQGQPGYGYPQGQQAPQGIPPQGYGYPQQGGPAYPQAPLGYSGGMPPFAGWIQRVGATIIDGLIVGVPYALMSIIGAAVGKGGVAVVFALLGFLLLIGVMLWLLYQEGTTGQTPGKKAVGIKVLRESDGQTIGFGMAFVRRLAHFLDSLACYIGWLWPLWDSKKQTFADKVCSTVVVKSF